MSKKHTIIALKNKGTSNREIERVTGINRKTVARHWKAYLSALKELGSESDALEAQELIVTPPRYDTSSRAPLKYTPDMDKAIDLLLEGEDKKLATLGASHKQKLTCTQIHEALCEQGFDIGITTVTGHVRKKRERTREAFIRQYYDLGARLEYDFGEVKLCIGGSTKTYHLAVLASPASSFRWAYLYESQKKDVFLDSHVRFFEMVGGVYKEVVYDNMKNVVCRFIGRNEKQLNADLVKMSMYYGFEINVTNCFAGNEKGYVESSVKWVRNKAFATRYHFTTLTEAREYLDKRLSALNAKSRIEEEKLCLLPSRPPLEIAQIAEHKVDKYSFIRVGNTFYSVPDYLVGHTLTVKSYPEAIIVFSGFAEVCRHEKQGEHSGYVVDVFHYLTTLKRKPGALKNSVALRSQAQLKEVFDTHYRSHPKDFICALERLKGKSIDEIAEILTKSPKLPSPTSHSSSIAENVYRNTQQQLKAASAAFLRRGEKVAH